MTLEKVGDYRLEQLLGVGGMGEVYEAYDTHRHRLVALKLLPEAFSGDQEYLRRFQRESYVAARLREPHVIPIHDFGEVDGRLFIDMRLVDGTDGRMLIDQNGPVAPRRAVNLISQVAQALDAAHGDGLIHRDIKPSNILVTATDFVYVVDFGIARSMGGQQTSLTITGATIGTLDYMAPERFAGQEVDGRADIYSLACVLHECLTAQPPFRGKDLPSLMYDHLYSSPPQASSLAEGVPPALDAVIARGMAKDPADRFASAGALADAAQEALLTEAPSPAPLPRAPASPPWTPARPPRPPAPPGQIPAGDRAAAGQPPDPGPEPADVRATVSTPHRAPPVRVAPGDAGRSPGRPATRGPAGGGGWRRRGLLVLAGAAVIGVVVALVLNFAKPDNGVDKARKARAASSVPAVPASVARPTVVTRTTVGKSANSVAVAPNGRFAYVADQDADEIAVLNTATNQVSRIINIPQGAPQFVSFSPNSQYAYVSIYNTGSYDNDSATVHLVDFVNTATDAVTAHVQVDNDKPGPSTTSPDGRYLYVPNHDMTMGSAHGNIVDVIDTVQKSVVARITTPMNPHWLVFSKDGRYFYTSDHMAGQVSVVNAKTNKVTKNISVGETPHGEALSPSGSRLAVTSWSGNEVFIVNTVTDKVVAHVAVGKNPQADAYSPDGRHLYAVNNLSNTVTVIDTADNRVTATISTGKAPTSISVLPSGRRAYVSDQADGTVEVLDIAK